MVFIYFAIIALLVGIDQLFKYLVLHFIELRESISVIRIGKFEIFNLTHILNDGAGWSIFSGKKLFLISLTSILLIFGIIFFIKNLNRHRLLTISLILVISGGLGNLIDRVFRKGQVIDYIETRFIKFPIFNFADICVVFGAIILAVYILFFDKPEQKPQLNTDGLESEDEQA